MDETRRETFSPLIIDPVRSNGDEMHRLGVSIFPDHVGNTRLRFACEDSSKPNHLAAMPRHFCDFILRVQSAQPIASESSLKEIFDKATIAE